MALGGNDSLSNQNFVADGAVLALSQTGFRAGGFNRRVDHFRMALGGNDSLSNQNFVADGTVLTLSQTGFCAGRINSGIDHFRMALSRYVLGIAITTLGASICCCTSFGASCCVLSQFVLMVATVYRQANSSKNCIGVSAGVVPCPNRVKIKCVVAISADCRKFCT